MGSVGKVVGRVVGGLAMGVAGNAVYDALKSSLSPTAAPTSAWPANWPQEIIVEWLGAYRWKEAEKSEGLLRLALEHRQKLYGSADHRTAISLDALAMCLDAQRRHRDARALRERVLIIERRINGIDHRSTATALSNLGLTLAAQGQHREAVKRLAQSWKTVRRVLGQNDTVFAAVAWNLYSIIKVRGQLASALPPNLPAAENDLRKTAVEMMARKRIFVAFDAMHEAIEEIKPLVGLR